MFLYGGMFYNLLAKYLEALDSMVSLCIALYEIATLPSQMAKIEITSPAKFLQMGSNEKLRALLVKM